MGFCATMKSGMHLMHCSVSAYPDVPSACAPTQFLEVISDVTPLVHQLVEGLSSLTHQSRGQQFDHSHHCWKEKTELKSCWKKELE